MTVTTTKARSGPYAGDGIQTSFPYDFLTYDEEFLDVYLTIGGVDVLQTLNVDYTVTGVGDEDGGTIEMVVPPAVGEALTIIRVVPELQETRYSNQGGWFPEVHERGFDELTMMVQQNSLLRNLSVQVPLTDPEGLNYILPPVASRRESGGTYYYITFDANGNVIVNTGQPGPEGPPGTGLTQVTADDTTPDYAEPKIVIGSRQGRVKNPSGNEQLALPTPWADYGNLGDPVAQASDGYVIPYDTSAGDVVAKLDELANFADGTVLTFLKVTSDTNTLTIDPNGTEQINDQDQLVLRAPFASATIRKQGGAWHLLATNGAVEREIQLRAGAWQPSLGANGAGYAQPVSGPSQSVGYQGAAFDFATQQYSYFDWTPPKLWHPAAPIGARIKCSIEAGNTNTGVAWTIKAAAVAAPFALDVTFTDTVTVAGNLSAAREMNELVFADLPITGMAPGKALVMEITNEISDPGWTLTGAPVYLHELILTYYEMQATT